MHLSEGAYIALWKHLLPQEKHVVFIYFNQCIIMGWVYSQARVSSFILKAKDRDAAEEERKSKFEEKWVMV